MFGVATPTESAAVASLVAFIVGKFVYKELELSKTGLLFVRTATNSSLVIFMIAAAGVFGWVIIYETLPQRLAEYAVSLTSDPFVFLLIVNVVLLLIGMVIEGIAALILVTPILLPIAQDHFGIDPFHFGVVICLNLVLGLLTPPVGAGLYVASSLSEVAPYKLFRALLPFLAMTLLILFLLSWQPWLVTILIE